MVKNNFVHLEFSCTDINKAREFYSQVFNWEISSTPDMPDYLFFDSGTPGLSGGISLIHEIPSMGTCRFYVNVEDIDDKLRLILDLGGKLILERTSLPGDRGDIARFEDPFGNIIGIWEKT